MKKQVEQYDVVVCGGGLAGVCAAIAAARSGASACILQDRPVFGGNSSSEIRVVPQGAANYHAYARETGIISELLEEERAVNHEPNHNNGRTNSVWDMILYDKIVSEPNLAFHLNTSVYDVRQGVEGRIAAVFARVAHAEIELEIGGSVFIDCTGDGIVADLAGCGWRMGTESRGEFGEPHAPAEASADVMGSSIHFRAKDMGRPVPFTAPSWAHHYDDPDVFYRRGRIPEEPEGGYWWIELGVPWHTIEDNETIRHELTRHVLGIWDFIKNRDPHLMKRAETWALDWIGQVPGKRESRRIMGNYLLTELDLLEQTAFGDEVAYGGWYVDLHRPGGLLAEYSEQAATEGHHSDYMKKSYVGPYGIPLRCLLARDVPNLILAGRNISVTHVALGSTRVMGTTALLGQAAGTAAALAVHRGMTLAAVQRKNIAELQQQLLRDGCFLLHATNADPADLARSAQVFASSEARFARADAVDAESTPASGASDGDFALTEMHGQWIALGSDTIESISVCLSNPSREEQSVDAVIVPVDHLWDYRIGAHPPLASTKLAVPPGARRWIRWDLHLDVPPQLQGRYVRLELGANPHAVWHRAKEVVYGMTAAYDLGTGRMNRLGNGLTLAFAIEPAQCAYPAVNAVGGAARPYQGTNLWKSDPAEALPQWIELAWDQPVTISRVQLVFPGHLLRDYRFYPPMYRDPECPREYAISVLIEGGWQEVARERDNYRCRRVHDLPDPVSTDRIRMTLFSTHGDAAAAIHEIRVYQAASIRSERRAQQ